MWWDSWIGTRLVSNMQCKMQHQDTKSINRGLSMTTEHALFGLWVLHLGKKTVQMSQIQCSNQNFSF